MERATLFLRENIRLLLGLAVVIFITVFIVTLLISKKGTQVLLNGQTFKVDVAKTDSQLQVGLSNRKQIGENQGMLFLFETPSYYSFWMKEMKFPIDIIYINGDKVTTVIENAKPPSSSSEQLIIYEPQDKSDKVLEINAGLARKYNIKKDTIVKIENL